MLQNIRDNSQGWIAKTIIGIIVALMAFTGIEAIFQASGNSKQDVAKVNGEEITQTELSQAVDMQRRQLMQQLGKDFDASLLDEKLLREAALKGLIDRKLLLQSAANSKFGFSEAALDQVILQTPEFQVDGKFSAERFDQVIRQLGYTRMQFRQMMTQEMLMGQVRAGIVGSAFVTDAEVLAFARLEKQTRAFAVSFQRQPVGHSVAIRHRRRRADFAWWRAGGLLPVGARSVVQDVSPRRQQTLTEIQQKVEGGFAPSHSRLSALLSWRRSPRSVDPLHPHRSTVQAARWLHHRHRRRS